MSSVFKQEWVQGMKCHQQSGSHRQIKLYHQKIDSNVGYLLCNDADIDNSKLVAKIRAQVEEKMRCLKTQKTPRLIKAQQQP